jgi:hypothetical protein
MIGGLWPFGMWGFLEFICDWGCSMWFATQGGGRAVLEDGVLVWLVPPGWLVAASGVRVGDPVPEEWGVQGPFPL